MDLLDLNKQPLPNIKSPRPLSPTIRPSAPEPSSFAGIMQILREIHQAACDTNLRVQQLEIKIYPALKAVAGSIVDVSDELEEI